MGACFAKIFKIRQPRSDNNDDNDNDGCGDDRNTIGTSPYVHYRVFNNTYVPPDIQRSVSVTPKFAPLRLTNHLFIGTYADASCFNDLLHNNIKHVLNLTRDTHGAWFAYKKLKITNLQIHFEFWIPIELLYQHTLTAIHYINTHTANKKNILIHGNTAALKTFIVFYIYKSRIGIHNIDNSRDTDAYYANINNAIQYSMSAAKNITGNVDENILHKLIAMDQMALDKL